MNNEPIIVEHDGRIARLRLNRPRVKNRLSYATMRALRDALRRLHDEGGATVLILEATGDEFCWGIDLTDPEWADVVQQPLADRRRLLGIGPQVVRLLADLDAVTICAMQGRAIGGGACLALACDFRIATPDCTIAVPEIKLGMNLSWEALPLLVQRFGPATAREMALLGRPVDTDWMRTQRLVHEVVEPDELPHAAGQLAERLLANPPVALTMIKRSLRALEQAQAAGVMHMDGDQYLLATGAEDFAEAMAAFFEKRKPEYRGR